MAELTAERLRELVTYDPETGVMRRRASSQWAKAGEVVGCRDKRGRLQGRVGGQQHMVHRLAWFYVHGEWPQGKMQHVNGDRSDNRLCNLTIVRPWSGAELTAAMLRELVSYDAETGVMRWKVARKGVRDGDVVGSLNRIGYLFARVGNGVHPVHRLAWLYVYGEWPRPSVDHINGDRADNRICNLRLATQSQQNGNSRVRADSSSGHTGVCWCERRRYWRAYVTLNGKQRHLGNFSSKQAAIAARKAAAERVFGEFAAHICRRPQSSPSSTPLETTQ